MLITPSFCHVALVALMFRELLVAARITLGSDENISKHVHANRRDASGFTITAEISRDATNTFTSSKTISVDVVKAKPAVTQDTYIMLDDDTPIQLRDSTNNILDDLLVSDVTTTAGRSGLTILAVNPITNKTQGIVEQKGGKSMKLRQESNGGLITAVEEESMDMPKWECGVGKDETLFHRTLEDEIDEHHGHEEKHTQHVSSISLFELTCCPFLCGSMPHMFFC